MEASLFHRKFRNEDEFEAPGPSREGTEVHLQEGELALCFLVDDEGSSMRVIDFRAGPQPGKLEAVQRFAEMQGIARVFVVVEREEAATWLKLGFEKEAVLPAFYKRSDGHVLGLVLSSGGPQESSTRIRIRRVGAEPVSPLEAARRLVRGKKLEGGTPVKVAVARDKDIERALTVARGTGRAVTHLAPFSRDVERGARLCTARGGFSVLVGVEVQRCFGSVFLEPLVPPRGEKEIFMIASALEQICSELRKDGLVSAFALTPTHLVELSASMLAAGFRPTGELREHLLENGQHYSATAWSKKLGEPD